MHAQCQMPNALSSRALLFLGPNALSSRALLCLGQAVRRGAHLNWADVGKGRTALWVAAYYGEEQCVRLLVDAGAPVDQPNVNGATPLWVACQGGYDGVAAVLLKSGAAVDAPMRNGSTPLLVAMFGNRVACVRTLLSHGADASHVFNGKPALAWATDSGFAEIVALIEAALAGGASVGVPSSSAMEEPSAKRALASAASGRMSEREDPGCNTDLAPPQQPSSAPAPAVSFAPATPTATAAAAADDDYSEKLE